VSYVIDPVLQTPAQVLHCRSCHVPVYFSLTDKQRRAPFEVDASTGEPTRINHFTRCPDARRWTRKRT
jgi:hypothetical protein